MKRFKLPNVTLTGKLAIVFAMLLALVITNTAIIYRFQASQRTDAAIVDAAGRDRMLSQRIGLLAEQVLLGHDEIRPLLQEMVDLHDASFLALRDGGIAPGIANDEVLPATIENIRPLTTEVDNLWQEYKRNAQIIVDEPRLNSGTPDQKALTLSNSSKPTLLRCSDATTILLKPMWPRTAESSRYSTLPSSSFS